MRDPGARVRRLLELVLEDEEVVRGRHRDYTLVGVPCRVEYLLVKVQAVYAYFVLERNISLFSFFAEKHMEITTLNTRWHC